MRQRPAALLGGKVKVHNHNEVERGRRRPPLDDIGLDPGHFHATVGRQSLCLGQPGAREIGAGNAPTLRGEPHGVASLATGNVERPTRRECVQFLYEKAVRLGLPDQFLGSVPFVPMLAIHATLLAWLLTESPNSNGIYPRGYQLKPA